MARYSIKGVDLALRLDISTNAMSNLRNSKTMPRLDGVALDLLCNALNELAQDLDKAIAPADLLDYSPSPVNPTDAVTVFSLIKRRRKKREQDIDKEQTGDKDVANAS
ncbi:MAG: helix-turn-helix transcriptional regulator [Methylacidiphilales bacterium]|nr:helix-turn-helix transcriptional regulator [Candidatus Methylacidiphilales bacterium]NJR19306.1 helix-turn-helix transcriptional regulator [Calothrix sp. CSU_2_0]